MMSTSMENYPFYIPHFAYPVLTLSGGEVFTDDAGKSQSVIDQVTHVPLYYHPHHDELFSPIFGGFAGTEMFVRPDWHVQLGVSYYQPITFRAQGTITPGPYDYSYYIRPHQLLVESKLLYTCLGRFHPYVSGGVGVSFNNAYRYNDGLGNHFDDHVSTSWSYMVGAGIDYDLNMQWRLGVGYRFNNFGRTDLDNANLSGLATSSKFSQQHFYANEVLAQLSYIIF